MLSMAIPVYFSKESYVFAITVDFSFYRLLILRGPILTSDLKPISTF